MKATVPPVGVIALGGHRVPQTKQGLVGPPGYTGTSWQDPTAVVTTHFT